MDIAVDALTVDERADDQLKRIMVQRPRPCILDEFDYQGYVHGAMRWTSDQGARIYTWDSLHGEVEVFNKRGKHIGVKHAVSGDWIKDAVPGRTIDV